MVESFSDRLQKNFLGNTKSQEYKEIVLHNHLEYFSENLGALSEEQGERFHQDIKIMEKRYQGRSNVHMTADYCWCFMSDEENFKPSRKSKKRKFFP